MEQNVCAKAEFGFDDYLESMNQMQENGRALPSVLELDAGGWAARSCHRSRDAMDATENGA